MNKLVYVKDWTYADEDSLKGYKECDFDEYHRDALIKELIEHNYIICGDTHQCKDFKCIPIFNDGYLILSMRVWAEIMKDTYRITNKPNICPNFYMACLCNIKENLPV